MMVEQQVVVGLDVGTTKVCTFIGEVKGNLVRIVGVGIAPSRGIRKGVVVDMDEAAAAITTSVRKAETFSGYRIVGAHVAVSGAHLSCERVHGRMELSQERAVSGEDLSRALESAHPLDVPSGRRVLHVLPNSYVVDGEEGIRNPVGMLGSTLEVDGLTISAGTAPLQNVARCVERAGLQIDGLVAGGLASAHAALTDIERQLGVLLIDLGGGTTDLAWLRDEELRFAGTLPFGGSHVTNDLAMVLGVPFAAAEDLKVRYASAFPSGVHEDEMVDAGSPDEEGRQVSRHLMSEVAEARLYELLCMAADGLKENGFDGVLPAGVVLTGGAAQLKGLRELAQDVFRVPARIGQPEGLEGPVDSVTSPAYSTGIGLLRWVLAQPGELASGRPVRRKVGLGDRLKGVVRTFLP